jgi:tetratricopeptide (TPR) repeat protein
VKKVSRFREHLRLGNYRGAFAEAIKERDPLKRVKLIAEIISRSYREEFLPALLESLSEVTSPQERAVAESYVGRACYALELEKEGEKHFEKAFEAIRRIPSPALQGEALTVIGKNLVLSGRYTDGLEAFKRAYDLFQASRGLYSEIVSNLTLLAKAVEESAEEIPNEKALSFYSLAAGIYDSIGFRLQAREIKEKMKLAEEVFKRGSPAVTELLERGDADKALQMARFLPPAERAVAMLNVSYWLFIHEMDDLGKVVFNDALEMLLVGKFPVKEREIETVAYKFLRIGKAEKALTLAGLIKDSRRFSELVGEIALYHAKRGDIDYALELATRIGDILIRDKIVISIKRIKGEIESASVKDSADSERPPKDENKRASNQIRGVDIDDG